MEADDRCVSRQLDRDIRDDVPFAFAPESGFLHYEFALLTRQLQRREGRCAEGEKPGLKARAR